MKASELISLLQACVAEGDREVVFEVQEAVGASVFGSPEGFLRDGSELLVLIAAECDKPDIVP